jgi:UDP-N-acetylglucosamine acyltransferase
MTTIHATAVIHNGATIGKDCQIGPYCVIGSKVVLGDRCVLHSHVVIDGNTRIGDECEIFPFASIGLKPQDLKFKGEDSRLVVGKKCIIREYCTMQPGTSGDRMETTIGDNCLFMASTHVAHDCVVGNNVILANCATLAGHVHIGDWAFIGGLSAIIQRVRIGHNAMIGGMSGVESDVIPYGMVMGQRASLAGLNFVGLERRGVEKADIQVLRNAYKKLFDEDEGTFAQRLENLEKDPANNNLVENVLKFIHAKSGSALCQPKKANG